MTTSSAPATKAARHGRITDLVRDHVIHSQTELAELLAGTVDVVTADLGRLAQLVPGEGRVRFEAVELR